MFIEKIAEIAIKIEPGSVYLAIQINHRRPFAALPPDVRKVYDLPGRIRSLWGSAPNSFWKQSGRSPLFKNASFGRS